MSHANAEQWVDAFSEADAVRTIQRSFQVYRSRLLLREVLVAQSAYRGQESYLLTRKCAMCGDIQRAQEVLADSTF
jgi:hypothetical protein